MYHFNGFSRESIDFLKDLKVNNNKPWFDENRNIYRKYVFEPLQNLVMDLSEFMLTIDPYFETRPQTDKTIARIYRDIRFSKDKSPYRSNIWITFKRLKKDWKNAPGYYFEIFPYGYRYGMGFYQASKTLMDNFREHIDENPEKFLKVTSFSRNYNLFELQGENYKRILDPTKSEEILEWYQKKSFHLAANKEINNVLFGRELIDDLVSGFQMLAPLYQYLMKIKLSL